MKHPINYHEELAEFWPTIMRAWDEHGKKNPIIECDLATQTVRAMPAMEYIEALASRTRKDTLLLYDKITSDGGMMVFVRDTNRQILQSYMFSYQDEE